MRKLRFTILLLFLGFAFGLTAQEYELVWEENFDGTELNMDVWTYDTPTGVWNWGENQELQYYSPNNVAVGPDGEGGNALIITAKREDMEGYKFTSGRIHTRGKVGVRYGKIEARIKLPVLADGLWPAFWMLGTQNVWPASGEIDILEAGHNEGIAAGTIERSFNGALHWQHAGGYAGYGYQNTEPEGASLYQYNTFTLEWTPTTIKMFFNDNTTPYYQMNIDGADAEEFRDWQHYFILNLAVGGSFPGITNPDAITAPFPAQMMVDYIKVYQKDGEGDITVAEPIVPPTSDYYGIFTENPAITERFVIDDLNNAIYIWDNSLEAVADGPVYEGGEALNFAAFPARTWFGYGINAANGLNLSHYNTGYLNLSLRTAATNKFHIEISDINNQSKKIDFVNGSDPYGFVRDGKWHTVSIPVSEFINAGVDFSNLGNVFALAGDGAISHIFVDDVYFSTTNVPLANSELNANRDDEYVVPVNKVEADYYGIFTENPNITTKLLIDDVYGHVYSWGNTLVEYPTTPYDGEALLAWRTTGDAGWFGFGIHDDKAANLTHFANGTLSFAVKTTSQESFVAGIEGANGTKGFVTFAVGNDPAGFERDGEWHRITVPMADLGVDLSIVPIPFYVAQGTGSTTIADGFAVDDVYLTVGAEQPENPNLYGGDGSEVGSSTHPDWDVWFGDGGAGSVVYYDTHLATVTVSNAGWASYSAQLFRDNMEIPDGTYKFTFKAKADAARSINVNVGKGLDVAPWFDAFMDPVTFNLTTEWQTFTHSFVKSNAYDTGKLVFELGTATTGTAATKVYFDEVTFGPSVGINNKTNNKTLNVYPNPAQGVVYVNAEVGEKVSLYNITGVLVSTQIATGSEVSFDLTGLVKGLYLVEVGGQTVKLIVQ